MLDARVPDRDASPPSASGLLPGWIGARAYDADGARIGHVADVLLEAQSRRPGWLVVALPRVDERCYDVRCGPGPWQGVVEPSPAGSGARMRAGRPV